MLTPQIELMVPRIRICTAPDMKNHCKRPSVCGQKRVEMYSSTNAAARDPEKRVFYNYLHKLIKSKHNHKEN